MDDFCNESVDNKHEPDWDSLVTDQDGESVYLDIHCKHCGKHGCVQQIQKEQVEVSW